MSIRDSRSYLRARASAIGLKEWTDGINTDNIPASVQNKSFSLGLPNGSAVKLNQTDQTLTVDSSVKIFLKGYKDTVSAIDNMALIIEDLIKECEAPRNRLTQSNGIKNVNFTDFNIDQLGNSNDNVIVGTVTFRIMTVLAV